jgi:carbamoyltransferase
MSSWLSEKIQIKQTLGEIFSDPGTNCPIFFAQHHESHAASAFYPSPFEEAAILTIDGVGEWATTTLASGKGKHVEILKEIRFPHSLGLLYSTITAFCGFRVNSGEYKLMGLAPYGKAVYADILREKVIQIHEDGSFHLNLDYFGFLSSDQMDHPRLHALLGGPPRQPDTPMEERFMDIAASIQAITEEIMIKLARHAHAVTGHRNLCLAGGVALNCVGNGKILKEGVFERLWIQPAAGDAGGALGAALAIYHQQNERKSIPPSTPQNIDRMHGALLGPEYDQGSIDRVLQKEGATYQTFTEEAELLSHVASWLDQGLVVGWMQGRMEFGPRALGNRSILGDPRSSTMQSLINRKIKYRESFRPFAPSILQERAEEFFQLQGQASPYMLMVAPTQESIRLPAGDEKHGLERLHTLRSTLPAVTHVDDSARVQSVSETTNPLFYRLLKTFEKQTGCPALINTSFNVRGEPIVCSPKDAYDCFMNTEMDILVIGPCVLKKEEQSQQAPKPSFHPVPD